MKELLLLEKYPLYFTEIAKEASAFATIDAMFDHLKARIEADPVACNIGEFDQYQQVAAQPEGKIAEGIQEARLLMFCFANAIPNQYIGALRPRAISIVEMAEKFVISFIEAPAERAQAFMTELVESLKKAG